MDKIKWCLGQKNGLKLIERARIYAQYYSDRNVSDEIYEEITHKSALFLAKCKSVLNDINERTINNIRNEVMGRI